MFPLSRPEPTTSSSKANRKVCSEAIATCPPLIKSAPITTALRCPIQRSAIWPPSRGVKYTNPV